MSQLRKALLALLLATGLLVGGTTAPAEAAPVTLSITSVTYSPDEISIGTSGPVSTTAIGANVTITNSPEFNPTGSVVMTVIGVGTNSLLVDGPANPSNPYGAAGGTVSFDDNLPTNFSAPVTEYLGAEGGDTGTKGTVATGNCSGQYKTTRTATWRGSTLSWHAYFKFCKESGTGTKFIKIQTIKFTKGAGTNCNSPYVSAIIIDPENIGDPNGAHVNPAPAGPYGCGSATWTIGWDYGNFKVWPTTFDATATPYMKTQQGVAGFPATYQWTGMYKATEGILFDVPW